MEFNILSPKENREITLTEFDFWVYYIQLIEIKRPSLSMLAIRVLANLLTLDLALIPKDPTALSLVGQAMRIKPTPKNQYPSLYRIYKNLIATGYLQNIDDEYYIVPNLNNFRKYVKQNINKEGFDINFIFKFKITNGDLG